MNVRWNGRALRDLARIQAYIEARDPQAAKRVSKQIKASALKLKRFPKIGRISDEIDLRLLQVVGRPYLLTYRVDKSGVEIVSVFDARRDPEDLF